MSSNQTWTWSAALVAACTLLGCASSHRDGNAPADYHDSCVALVEIYCDTAPAEERRECRAEIPSDCSDPDWPESPPPTVNEVNACLAAFRLHPVLADLRDIPPECLIFLFVDSPDAGL